MLSWGTYHSYLNFRVLDTAVKALEMVILEVANGSCVSCVSTAGLPSVLCALVFDPGTCLEIFLCGVQVVITSE